MDKQIQAGQWWRTKGGHRAYVVGRKRNGLILTELQGGALFACESDGAYLNNHDFDLVEHLPWCKSFDCKEPPKPKKVETLLAVNADNKITGFVYRGARYEKGERFVKVREVHTDEELEAISQEITENTSGVFTAKCFSILKKHFGGPSE